MQNRKIVLYLHRESYPINMKRTTIKRTLSGIIAALAIISCTPEDDFESFDGFEKSQDVSFDITITRDGEIRTRGGGYDNYSSEQDMEARLDPTKPFGLMGVDAQTRKVLINNERVFETAGIRSATFDSRNWYSTESILLSAYYPYANETEFMSGNKAYIIPYLAEDTQAGPLVSHPVERRASYLDVIPLVFRHITNDIGFRICDITYNPDMQGLIRLKKVSAHNFATEGYYIDSIGNNGGRWVQKTIRDEIGVFNGNARVGVGTDNELFVGSNHLVSERAHSSRFYAIPEDIKMGKQYIEVVFDVDAFDYNGQHYRELKDQVQKFPLYGVLPGNSSICGKQYTFHLGLDLATLYQPIEFSATVSDWENSYNVDINSVWGENKIYEDNDFF